MKSADGIRVLRRFVRLARVGQIYNIFILVLLIVGKKFIIKVVNEITFNCVLNYVRKGHIKVVRFYIKLRPTKGGHVKVY